MRSFINIYIIDYGVLENQFTNGRQEKLTALKKVGDGGIPTSFRLIPARSTMYLSGCEQFFMTQTFDLGDSEGIDLLSEKCPQ